MMRQTKALEESIILFLATNTLIMRNGNLSRVVREMFRKGHDWLDNNRPGVSH
jgi:hypothetical protein